MLILHSNIIPFIFTNLIEEKSLKDVLRILCYKISKTESFFFPMKMHGPFLWPTSRVSGNGPQEFSPSSDSTDIFHEKKPRAVTSIELGDYKFCLSQTATQHTRSSGSRDTRDTSRSWKGRWFREGHLPKRTNCPQCNKTKLKHPSAPDTLRCEQLYIMKWRILT